MTPACGVARSICTPSLRTNTGLLTDAQQRAHAYLLCQLPAVQSAGPAGAAPQPLSDERACSPKSWTYCLCLVLCSPQTSGNYLVLDSMSAPIHRLVMSVKVQMACKCSYCPSIAKQQAFGGCKFICQQYCCKPHAHACTHIILGTLIQSNRCSCTWFAQPKSGPDRDHTIDKESC